MNSCICVQIFEPTSAMDQQTLTSLCNDLQFDEFEGILQELPKVQVTTEGLRALFELFDKVSDFGAADLISKSAYDVGNWLMLRRAYFVASFTRPWIMVDHKPFTQPSFFVVYFVSLASTSLRISCSEASSI